MSFPAGTRLGPYEIVAPIGAGGMGEVYRARDTRLDRTVAIKVLSGALAEDADARQRFEQEARAIAALNDPHICTIHDVGRHGDLEYLVLEYLQGETLAEWLRRSPTLPIDEALAIAIMIGDALDRAHAAGIVHRDLKPGNVMCLRRNGASGAPDIKLLDFGLAAWTSAAARPQPAEVSLATTMAVSQVMTRLAGAPIASGFSGTVQYMAPELFAGDPGDHRADIFAFGCVVYEMIAGRKAFDGASAMSVIAAITSTEPAPVPALQSAFPLLDHVLRRCLEKDRERRWQSMRDVTGELRWIAEQPRPTPAATPQRGMPPLARAAAAAAIVLAGAAAALSVYALRGSSAPPVLPPMRFEVATAPTDDPSLALSPDGTQIAYVANQNRVPMLWVRSLDAIEPRVLASTQGARFPFWSPDGRTIGFFADDKLKRIDVAGGSPLTIADAPNARGGTWNAEGVILFAPGVAAPIMRVSTRGGAAERVTDVSPTSPGHRWPQFLPDGRRFLFSSALGTPDTNGVYLGSLDKTPPVRLIASDGEGRFAAPGALLTIRNGALLAYRFDAASGEVQGEPQIVAQGFAGAAANSTFTASGTGVLAYRAASTGQRRQLAWVDRQGKVLRAIGEPEADARSSPELSADEQSVVLFLQRTGENDIWTIDLSRALARRITDGPPADAHPLWDPDGQHVIFSTRRFGNGGPARQALNGGKPAPLFSRDENGLAVSWTRDRRYVLLRRASAQDTSDLIAVAVTVASGGEGAREVVVAQSPYDETEGQFSPDGRWVAFVSNESGRPEVYVQSFPEAQSRTQVSIDGGAQVRWSGDGKEIFYIAPDGRMMAVSLDLGGASPRANPDVKAPVPLFQTHLASGTNVLGHKPQYAVARDGRFLLNTAIESASAPIIVSVNWMKGRVPPR